MGVPKRRSSPSRRGKRRSHDAISIPNPVRCSRCRHVIERHTVCPNCGYYRGRPVVTTEEEV
ncbi:MAG: 50S ribosomal protein L32 [Planctomycetota bacterium]